MSRKLDVELTSAREDGSWTWRAVGAREPRGVVDGPLVPAGAKVGDELRAEADFDLDGVTIVSLGPKQEKKRSEAERIEIIGRPQREDQLVTSTLTSRAGGARRDRRDRGDRRDRPPREGGPDRADRGPRDRKPRDERGPAGERAPAGQREGRPPRDRAALPDASERPA